MMIKVTLKDGVEREFEKYMTVFEIASQISEGLARNCTSAELDGEIVDLRQPVIKDCTLNLLTFDDEKGKDAFWHTASHMLAQAVKRLFPEAKLAIGPTIDDGFYYDFDMESPFTAEQIAQIEEEMKKIAKEKLPITRFFVGQRESILFLREQRNEPYKIEIVNDLPDNSIIGFYEQGEFIDLCKGPHLMNTGSVKAIKLLSEEGSSGAYWRGNEKNKMLCRIYGTAFTKNSDLEAYLVKREDAKKKIITD